MQRKKAALTCLLLLAILTPSTYIYINIRPKNWSKIKSGMTRREVESLIGAPQMDWNEVKGCFWFYELPLVRHRLQTSFDDKQQATSVYISREIGTKNEFIFSHISNARLSLSSSQTGHPIISNLPGSFKLLTERL
jgi:outer membrane protein assembly factor BamE (lipoprotein component of BamABCDE complex)